MIVLDASAALEFVLRTPVGIRVEARIFQPGETLHAPHVIDVEIAHVLRRLAAGRTSAAFCEAALRDWMDLPVQRYPHDVLINRAWSLRATLTAYDAVYIALAELLDAPLVTHDQKMSAGMHKGRVEVV